eukprot:scaffold630_cov350-Pavlova_lutheri.AAC.12
MDMPSLKKRRKDKLQIQGPLRPMLALDHMEGLLCCLSSSDYKERHRKGTFFAWDIPSRYGNTKLISCNLAEGAILLMTKRTKYAKLWHGNHHFRER